MSASKPYLHVRWKKVEDSDEWWLVQTTCWSERNRVQSEILTYKALFRITILIEAPHRERNRHLKNSAPYNKYPKDERRQELKTVLHP